MYSLLLIAHVFAPITLLLIRFCYQPAAMRPSEQRGLLAVEPLLVMGLLSTWFRLNALNAFIKRPYQPHYPLPGVLSSLGAAAPAHSCKNYNPGNVPSLHPRTMFTWVKSAFG